MEEAARRRAERISKGNWGGMVAIKSDMKKVGVVRLVLERFKDSIPLSPPVHVERRPVK